jgi:hypothetical protein
MGLRKSHENPDIKTLYDTFLDKPGSHKAHQYSIPAMLIGLLCVNN